MPVCINCGKYQIINRSHCIRCGKKLRTFMEIEPEIRPFGWYSDDKKKAKWYSFRLLVHPIIKNTSGCSRCGVSIIKRKQRKSIKSECLSEELFGEIASIKTVYIEELCLECYKKHT